MGCALFSAKNSTMLDGIQQSRYLFDAVALDLKQVYTDQTDPKNKNQHLTFSDAVAGNANTFQTVTFDVAEVDPNTGLLKVGPILDTCTLTLNSAAKTVIYTVIAPGNINQKTITARKVDSFAITQEFVSPINTVELTMTITPTQGGRTANTGFTLSTKINIPTYLNQ